MLLAIDVGNTHTVLGLYNGQKLDRTTSGSSPSATAPRTSTSVLVVDAAQIVGLEPEDVDSSILASVVPLLTDRIAARGSSRVQATTRWWSGPGSRPACRSCTRTRKEVGADRIVNAVAAYERVRGGVIVVDFGTATTFDCVTQPRASTWAA